MALPKITQPEFEITLPVIKKKIKFRPFLVREEKVLLVGKEGSSGEQLNAMINLVEDVVLSPKNFNARDLTATDLEYLFMHLRAKSVNNIVKLKYQDKEDESVYDFELDLNTLEPTIDPDREYTLDIGDYKVEVKDPTIGIMEKVGMGLEGLDPNQNPEDVSPEQVDTVFGLLAHCLIKVYDNEQVYDDFTIDEAKEWFSAIDVKSFESIQTFFESGPKLEHKLEYVNKKGNNRTITLRGIQDFF